MKTSLSVIIIYSEGCDNKLFESAKKSVSWADELILIKGSKGNFSDWRNEGLKKAKEEWVLYLDSDEEVSPSLCEEVIQLISNMNASASINQYNTYALPRKNIIFNKEFRHSGQYPDYQKRLFRKSALKKWIGEVHEEPVFRGTIGHLKNSIIHHKNMTINQMIEKTNKWSEIESLLMFEANHPNMNIFRFFSAGFREFWLRFVKQTCFLDGTKGIIYGVYQIYSRLISYSKLWEIQLKNEGSNL